MVKLARKHTIDKNEIIFRIQHQDNPVYGTNLFNKLERPGRRTIYSKEIYHNCLSNNRASR